jgi:hypothetical protein
VKLKQTDFFSGEATGTGGSQGQPDCLASKFETVSGGHFCLGLISQIVNTPIVWFASVFRAFLSFSVEVNEGLWA